MTNPQNVQNNEKDFRVDDTVLRGASAEVAARPVRIVVPKKGRLKEAFDAAMTQAGLGLAKQSKRHDFGMLRDESAGVDTGVELLTMRNMDALRMIKAGVADMAVVGRDMFAEFNAAAKGALDDAQIIPLPMAQCALYIACPDNTQIADVRGLQGKRIATSFPALTSAWLAQYGVAATMVECEGGVEDMVRLGMADVVCDLVETGTTLAANGLTPTIKVMDSGAVMVVRPQISGAAAQCAAFTARVQNAGNNVQNAPAPVPMAV